MTFLNQLHKKSPGYFKLMVIFIKRRDGILHHTRFAVYDNRSNINTDFSYTIRQDSVFTIELSSDTLYFLDADKDYRTDIQGRVIFSPDTALILRNSAVSPGISIKYRLKD